MKDLPSTPDPHNYDNSEEYTKALLDYLQARDEFLSGVLDEVEFWMSECKRMEDALEDENKSREKIRRDHQFRVMKFCDARPDNEG